VAEYEQALLPRIDELVEELLQRDEWVSARSIVLRRQVIMQFLTEKADGYRLSPAFIEQVMRASRS
jgi:hypothetical protein